MLNSQYVVYLCMPITGPGVKSPEERTIDYLEEVAVECAKGIINKKISLRKEKGTMQSKTHKMVVLFSFGNLNPSLRS